LGKSILACKTKDELKDIYKTYSLYKHTKNTITSFDALLSNLNKSKKNGFSVNEAETFDYVYGIGAAILDSEGRPIAGISISGTKSTINIKTIPSLSIKVKKAAKNISKRLIEN